MANEVHFKDLGICSYKKVWDYQETLLKENVDIKTRLKTEHFIASEIENTKPTTTNYFLLVEHTPVYTLGKSGHKEHVLITDAEMQEKGIDYFHINRGGDITFHGLQQIVGYPILDLDKFKTDLGWYLRSLEEVIILTLAEYGLQGERSKGETGVWLDTTIVGKERKICALGIKCSRWVTMHGFAFNVNTNLDYFNYIVPCGIKNKQVTSLEKELGYTVNFEEVKDKVKNNFKKVFDVEFSYSSAVANNFSQAI